MWGQVVEVRLKKQGWRVAADTAAGAVSLPIRKGEDAEGSGTVQVNGQVVAYSSWDPTTGALQLVDALAAAADAGDNVWLYDTKRSAVVGDFEADVDIDDWDGEPPTAILEDGMEESLPLGPREPGEGEWARMYYDATEDEWYVDKTRGTGGGRGLKYEPYDPHTLTDGEIDVGSFTHQLIHTGVAFDRDIRCHVNGSEYGPPNLDVDSENGVVTVTLGGWETVDEDVWFEYRYREGPVAESDPPDPPPDPVPVNFTVVGSTGGSNNPSTTSAAFPAGTQAGDLFVYACISRSTSTNACPDSRAALSVDSTLSTWSGQTLRVWVGAVTDPATPLVVSNTGSSGPNFETSWQLMVIRPASPVDFDASKIADSGSQSTGGVGTIPGLSGVSGAIGVGFSAAGIGGAANHGWPSPWISTVTTGTYDRVSIAAQVNGTVAATPALTADAWRGFALGVGLG